MRLENTTFTTILAPNLLATTSIITVFDDIGTITRTASVNDCFYDHPINIPSLRLDQHRFLLEW